LRLPWRYTAKKTLILNTYDYQEGTLVFLGPGQTAGMNTNGEAYQPKGYNYTFFGYQSNEALHYDKH
jgi:hypothetical protein